MLVYGDRERREEPREMIRRIGTLVEDRAGVRDHEARDRLVEGLILAGELLQGLADDAFRRTGFDDLTPVQSAAMEAAVAVAAQLRDDLAGRRGDARAVSCRLARLEALALPETIVCRTGEGYAFYAVRPQDYLTVAARAPWTRPPLVIGLRSIGASLAAAVAAATDGEAITLRPFGPPFAREVRVSDALRSRLERHQGDFVLVDEGPGLSGSSFAAAARLLDGLGTAPERILFMPSHRGQPGAFASPAWRERWPGTRKLVRTLDDALAEDPVAGWFEDLTGPVLQVEDLSAGAWRLDGPPPWPPAFPALEGRKFRLTAAGGRYLVKLAGLGGHGRAKCDRGRRLHAAGFGPEILALRGGFLLMRWIEGRAVREVADRGTFLKRLAGYLGYRAAAFGDEKGDGASLTELAEMAVVNAERLRGPAFAGQVEARLSGLDRLAGELVPGPVDGRLCPWEWVEDRRGVLLKTDALDHAAGHDLVGFQDPAWDIAGAACEFRLDRRETAALADEVGRARGRAISLDAVEIFSLCYPALQASLWTMAETGAQPGDRPAVAARREACAAMLTRALESAA